MTGWCEQAEELGLEMGQRLRGQGGGRRPGQAAPGAGPKTGKKKKIKRKAFIFF